MEGQRWMSMIVDLAFFAVIGLLGLKRVLSEPILAALLSSYAAHRFGVAMGKQQAVIALSGSGGSGSGSSGSSGEHKLNIPLGPPPASKGPQSSTMGDRLSRTSAIVGWMG
jgi:hypothetical protein